MLIITSGIRVFLIYFSVDDLITVSVTFKPEILLWDFSLDKVYLLLFKMRLAWKGFKRYSLSKFCSVIIRVVKKFYIIIQNTTPE